MASDPIIEHCSDMRFGPLTRQLYDGFEGECVEAELGGLSEHWKQVQDFLHPGSKRTENWSMICPEC
jgi:hypothetical protein